MSENYWNRLRSNRVNRRRFLAATGVAAAGTAAILAGCGDDDEEASGPAAAAEPVAFVVFCSVGTHLDQSSTSESCLIAANSICFKIATELMHDLIFF